MKTKATYYKKSDECYSIDFVADQTLCSLRNSRLLWAIPVGWGAFVSLLLLFLLWLLLSRVIRLEKVKVTLL